MQRRFLLVVALLIASTAGAQERVAFRAVLEYPRVTHRPHYANLEAERTPRGRWVLDGCHALVRGACRRTRRVRLDARRSRELDALVDAVGRAPRCEEPSTRWPRFWIERDGVVHAGAMREDGPDSGPCGRLARFLMERFGSRAPRDFAGRAPKTI